MGRVTVGRALLTLTALYGGVGPFVADWGRSHLHNQAWTPHARFHDAQTMSLGAALGAVALAAVWAPGRWTTTRLRLAAGAASLYCATRLSASAFPGVALADPPAHPGRVGPQTLLAVAVLALNGVALLLERRQVTTGGTAAAR
ncbi:hypothetical protein GCM10025868_25670 [Angustibacter aerolatus]|uniref:Acetyltransferase n=1 Tax=Angustibacter aerolatus TaxID=1162965 RepID=A0ABQ6JKC2_9ACTN|nr:DUF6640 family protein [Angustibacter aerolatus]GMA87317.1 hypothetical protein GCM10025868_25670 [Angustibacter aerolatus]